MKKLVTLFTIILPLMVFAQQQEAKAYPNPVQNEGIVNFVMNDSSRTETVILTTSHGKPLGKWVKPGTSLVMPKVAPGIYLLSFYKDEKKKPVTIKIEVL